MKGAITLLRIEVTQTEIDSGKRHCGDSCPIALAIKKADPTLAYVDVDGSDIVVRRPGEVHYMHVRTPDDAQSFINRFDAGVPVNPITLELTLTHEEGIEW